MKRLFSAIVVVTAWTLIAGAQAGVSLKSLSAIHALSNAEASRQLAVSFEATVTYYRRYEKTLFVQDGDTAIYVSPSVDVDLTAGDRVLIEGTTHESFHPYVAGTKITVLGHQTLPQSVPVTFGDLINMRYDCRLVTLRATVRAADVLSVVARNSLLQLSTSGGEVSAVVDTDNAAVLKSLLDAEIEITGVGSAKFDGKMQVTGVLLHVSSEDGLKIVRPAHTEMSSLPLTPMDEILGGYQVTDRTQRVRVRGAITYYEPGTAAILQDGAKSLWIATTSRDDLHVGDIADAIGYPGVHDGFLILTDSEIYDRSTRSAITPRAVTWVGLASTHNLFDLVTIEGKVVTEVRETSQDEYILVSEGHLFPVVLRNPVPTNLAHNDIPRAPMREFEPGTTLRVTGICVVENSNPFAGQSQFRVLLRSGDDIAVSAPPSLVNTRNLMILVMLLLLAGVFIGTRNWMLERRVRQQAISIAARIEAEADLERRRARILEEMNGLRPLAEIIERITELVSSKLDGAWCWCQLSDGMKAGNCPAEPGSFRIVEWAIASRSGANLGTLFGGFEPQNPTPGEAADSLAMGAELVQLAVENRRLYSDLKRRSEFDLLTDLPNRFSFENQLDELVAEACAEARGFGLAYIDLDEFKQVNDVYGHPMGDKYLQKAAERMRRRLRASDVLARIGGDEFAALLPDVRSDADLQEVLLRLTQCFDEPFILDGVEIHGAASIGMALYPDDGATGTAVLSAADSSMYSVKHSRREQIGQMDRRMSQPGALLK